MCSIDVNSLANFNVYGTKTRPDFILTAPNLLVECEDIGPLAFCLIPPASRLETMCKIPTLDPFFEKVINGNVIHTLEDLPVAWDMSSAPNAEDGDPWVTLPNSPNKSDAPLSISNYLGLQPLPSFASTAASDNADMFFGIGEIDGVVYRTNSVTGLLQKCVGITGASDGFKSVVLSANGQLGAVLFSNALYFWLGETPNGASVFRNATQTGITYCALKLFETVDTTSIVVVGHRATQLRTDEGPACIVWTFTAPTINASDFALTSQSVLPLSEISTVAWTAIIPDNTAVIVAIDANSLLVQQHDAYVFEIGSAIAPTAPQWAIPRVPGTILPVGRWDAVCRIDGNSLSNYTIFATNRADMMVRVITLSISSNTATSVLFAGGSVLTRAIAESSNHQFFAFITTTNQVYAASGIFTAIPILVPATLSPGSGNFSFDSPLAFANNALQTWYADSTQRRLFANTNNTVSPAFGLNFVSNFDLFQDTGARVSDFGVPGLAPPAGTTWFFGTRIWGEGTIFPGASLTSPHSIYRMLVGPDVIASDTQFPHVTGSLLQRANLPGLMRNNTTRLYDNGELIVFAGTATDVSSTTNEPPRSASILWRSGTDDAWNSDSQSKPLLRTDILAPNVTVCSPNGLYVLFQTLIEPRDVRVSVNVFNSSVFADYCTAQNSHELFARAIARQAEFCWSQLRNAWALETDASNLFSDARCTCIAGPRLFDAMFPRAVSSSNDDLITGNESSVARLGANMPCLLTPCQQALGETEQVTNIDAYVAERCNHAALTVCGTALETMSATSTFNIGQGMLSQICGTNLLPCGQGNPCPASSRCVNGTCIPDCKNSADCLLSATCEDGGCVNTPQKKAQTPTEQRAKWAAVGLGITLAIALLLLLLILLLKPRIKKKEKTI